MRSSECHLQIFCSLFFALCWVIYHYFLLSANDQSPKDIITNVVLTDEGKLKTGRLGLDMIGAPKA